ncbi:hypothetical protein DR095_01760 [Mycoplasma flocculare]|uniref:Uncharacterized protein n=2 Tax=Mesomycoplasma flocculare TaxID=2128 RepID=A0A0A8E7T8_MESFC|nr:hypothetical protein [Mesomycoplasma flocculare]MXR39501.1 hypothetical protein [Mycoplasma sp. MF12]AJC50029.1 hypothetical protein MYF_02670 [Mesomycoplasma flocculare ATCC 27399]ENX51000.1 hypothetical protein MFC_01398 [Mesomycoplasma flocculare ATCC 27716]MXR05910.1 hypothetical protein [Mesomycoplasma flocculare]MXR12322.1 hypothetical protein [Mesomycoplasma flocculare]
MTKKELKTQLVELYDFKINELEGKSLIELEKLLQKSASEKITLEKNPNKFFYIKSMPKPKQIQQKTSEKSGWIVFFAFVFVLLLAFILFLTIAFINRG